MAVTDAGVTVPNNTAIIRVSPDQIVEYEAGDGNIVAGHIVGFVAGSQTKVISSSSNGGTQGLPGFGVAIDNITWDTTNHKQYAWDTAYPSGGKVRVAIGGRVTAIADSASVTAGVDVIATDQATVGYAKQAATAGQVVGRAVTSAGSAARFVLDIDRN